MTIRAVTDTAQPDPGRIYGDPYETADGTTIVTVTDIRRTWFRRGDTTPKPLGAFVIRGDDVRWVAAVDETRVALMGELIGLVAATLAAAAVLRRPPWPDLRR